MTHYLAPRPTPFYLCSCCIVTFYSILFYTAHCFAADKPEITRFSPGGVKVGGTESVACVGSFKSWPVSIWSSNPAVQWKCNEKAGEFEVAVQGDEKPAISWVRFYNAAGVTPPKPFLISNKKPIRESEPNDRILQISESVSDEIEVFGVLEKNGDTDLFRVDAKQGETISAVVDATRYLKSPLDAHLQLLDHRGFVLFENLDHYGLDPAIEYKIPKDGQYYLRVFGFPEQPDSTISFRGGPEYVYRLRWNKGPLELDSLPVVNEQWAVPLQLASPAIAIEDAMPVAASTPIFATFRSEQPSHYFKLPSVPGKLLQLRVLSQSIGSPWTRHSPLSTKMESSNPLKTMKERIEIRMFVGCIQKRESIGLLSAISTNAQTIRARIVFMSKSSNRESLERYRWM